MRFPILIVALVGLVGCSHPASAPPRPSSDPASPQAVETPLTPLPDTLRIAAVKWEEVKVPEDDSSMKGLDMGQDKKMGDEMKMGEGMKMNMSHPKHGQSAPDAAKAPTKMDMPDMDMGGMKMEDPKKPAGKNQKAGIPEKKAVQYTCVMHPEVISDRPGKCPKCGMKLVPKSKAEGQPKGDH